MVVYLSKSNLCRPERVAQARAALALDPTVKIVEYTGGTYSNQTLLEADILFMLTPNDIHEENEEVTIGRGQYDQACQFIQKHGDGKIFMITDVDMTALDIDYREVTGVQQWKTDNWKSAYGKSAYGKSAYGLITMEDDSYYFSHTESQLDHPKILNLKGYTRAITTNPCVEIELDPLLTDLSPSRAWKKLPFKKSLTLSCARKLGLV